MAYEVSQAKTVYHRVAPTQNDVEEPISYWFLVDSAEPRVAVAKCWSQADAQMIADALNGT